jgi:hypothetical protein
MFNILKCILNNQLEVFPSFSLAVSVAVGSSHDYRFARRCSPHQ